MKSIGEYAFSCCFNLKSIKLPDGLTELKDYVFTKCESLEKIEIPSSVKIIDENAFEYCMKIKQLHIPQNVDKIGKKNTNIFTTCYCLNSVTVDENNKYFCSDQGILYSKDKTKLICYPTAKIQENFVVTESVTEIGYRAFDKCNHLANVKISGECCTVSNSAFNCYNLLCVDIGKNHGLVDRLSFSECPLLKK